MAMAFSVHFDVSQISKFLVFDDHLDPESHTALGLKLIRREAERTKGGGRNHGCVILPPKEDLWVAVTATDLDGSNSPDGKKHGPVSQVQVTGCSLAFVPTAHDDETAGIPVQPSPFSTRNATSSWSFAEPGILLPGEPLKWLSKSTESLRVALDKPNDTHWDLSVVVTVAITRQDPVSKTTTTKTKVFFLDPETVVGSNQDPI